jgi:hypothetical protein
MEKLEKNVETMNDAQNRQLLAKLIKYSTIPQKTKNTFIIFKKNKIHIKLLNNKSLSKISSLMNTPREKNIYFKSRYESSDTDSDNDSKNGLRGMAKLKERLNKKSHDKNNVINNRRNKEKKFINNNKYQFSIKPEDKNSVILLEEVKSSVQTILNKEGNSVGTNYELYKMTWKNFYRWLLLFPLTILFGLIYFLYKDNYGFTFAEFFIFLIIFLICIVSINGNEKMLSKKKVNFISENTLLGLISFLSAYILVCANTNKIEYIAYCFLNDHYFLVHIIFFTLIVFCFVLIYLNKKMVGFYHRYSQIIESGVLLTDRS